MPVNIDVRNGGKTLIVKVTGKLTKEDYTQFVPRVESAMREHGKINMLFHMEDFHGWKAAALWEDLKFDVKHYDDIDRLAIVGEKKWQEWMTKFCRLFTTAELRFFGADELRAAQAWVEEPARAEAGTRDR